MIALIQMIYGLEAETWPTIWRKLRAILKMDPDFANLEYITPHFWTPLGRKVKGEDIIQLDQRKWGYRNQIVRVSSMSPSALFWGVKLSEALIHLRPKVILRALFRRDRYLRPFRRRGLWQAFKVWAVEIAEFYRHTDFAEPGEAAVQFDFQALMLNNKVGSTSVSNKGGGCPITGTAAKRAWDLISTGRMMRKG